MLRTNRQTNRQTDRQTNIRPRTFYPMGWVWGGVPIPSRLGGLGSVGSSPAGSGADRAPAANDIYAFSGFRVILCTSERVRTRSEHSTTDAKMSENAPILREVENRSLIPDLHRTESTPNAKFNHFYRVALPHQ